MRSATDDMTKGRSPRASSTPTRARTTRRRPHPEPLQPEPMQPDPAQRDEEGQPPHGPARIGHAVAAFAADLGTGIRGDAIGNAAVARAIEGLGAVGGAFLRNSGEPTELLPVDHADLAARRAFAERRTVALDAALAVPVLAGGSELLGVLTLWFVQPHELGPAEIELVESLGAFAAVAMERDQLFRAGLPTETSLLAILDQVPVGVVIVDREGRVVRNAKARAQYRGKGLSESAVSERLRELNPELDPEQLPLARTRRTGETVVNEEIELRVCDGTRRTFAISSAPVRATSGEVIAYAAVLVDVTAHRESEQARDAFVGVLSHELRTPVTAIFGGAQLLAHEGLPPEAERSLVGDITAEADRLERMIANLVVLSRVEHGVPLNHREPILVEKSIRHVASTPSPSWEDVRIELELEPSLPIVSGAADGLEQILGNLLSNVQKYAEGEALIEARRVGTGASEAVRMSVTDNGPGIEPDAFEHLFDLFYRSPAARLRATGSGIGLYVVRQLVEAMGGRVWAENRRRPDHGATFTIELPRYAG